MKKLLKNPKKLQKHAVVSGVLCQIDGIAVELNMRTHLRAPVAFAAKSLQI